jgi:hypothetical protein
MQGAQPVADTTDRPVSRVLTLHRLHATPLAHGADRETLGTRRTRAMSKPSGFDADEQPTEPGAAPVIESGEVDRPPQPAARTLEVEYVHEIELQQAGVTSWEMLEVWTRNRIYHVSAEMVCVRVTRRATGESERENLLLGAQLAGGERKAKRGDMVEIYFPFPMPGTEAVFCGGKKSAVSYTSTIERVVLRVRKMRVGDESTSSTWDDLTGRFAPR